MYENKYDDEAFFKKYQTMDRSVKGLQGAGEWHVLKSLLPEFQNKRVLDLGCGFGWHCQYAIERGASKVVGVDISAKMLAKAQDITSKQIEYLEKPLEELSFPNHSFDVIISSLTFHYIESFDQIVKNIFKWLTPGGIFVFSVEHPVFTAQGTQQWHLDDKNQPVHWPVDHYFTEGKRQATFLGESVIKYHKTLTTYLNTLITNGFTITNIIEPQPQSKLVDTIPGMKDELRRPMMLIVKVIK